MGFRQGAYAKVWSIEDKGNYSIGQVSVSRKNKDTDKYEAEFQDGFVRFVGNAHEAAKNLTIGEKGASIQITSCDVTNKYDADKQKAYTNFVIFGFEATDGNATSGKAESNTGGKAGGAKKGKSKAEPVDDTEDDDLPF